MTKYNKRISEETRYKIAELYGTMKAQDIADMFGIAINQVYNVGRTSGKSQPQNKEVIIDSVAEQIILSGILGDGRLRKNGKNKTNTYYSECHANGETDYLMWKFDNLGELTKASKVYGKNKVDDEYGANEFATLTTPSLNKYYNMTKLEVIDLLTDLGLLLYLLDDGWSSKYVSGLRFTLCLGELNEEEQISVKNRFDNTFDISSKIYVGKDRPNDLSFSSRDGCVFVECCKKYLPNSLDIIKKKFKGLIL